VVCAELDEIEGRLYVFWQYPPFEPDEPAFYVIKDGDRYATGIFNEHDELVYLSHGHRALNAAKGHLWHILETRYVATINAWARRHKAGTAARPPKR
jgi:hypothetical protein